MVDGANGSEVGTVRDGMVIHYESLGLAIPKIVLAKWQSIVDTLVDLTKVAASCIMRLDGNRLHEVVANYHKNHSLDFSSIDCTSKVRSFCEAVAREQRTLLVINALNDARWRTYPEVQNGIISYLGIPILWPDQTTFGTICVKDRKENAHLDKYERLITEFRTVVEDHLERIYLDAKDRDRQMRQAISDRCAQKENDDRDRLLKQAYQNLKRAEQLAKIGHWTWDVAERRFTWSDMLYEMNGWDPSEAPPDSEALRRLLTPESLSKLQAVTEKCLLDGMPYKLECECIRLNGEHFWGHVRGAALKDKSGKIISLVGTVQDISEQKEAQQALRESESRWQFALNGSGDGVWDWDFEKQKIILSAQGKAMLGYSDNDDFGTSETEWLARVHPADIVRLQKKMVTHLLGKTPVFAAEYRLRTNSGSWRWFLSRGKVVEYGPNKRPVRAIGTTTDISGRKETEARILALNERLELAVSSAGVGIWEYDMVTGNGLVNGQMNYIYRKIQKEDPAKVLPLAPGDNFKELFAILHPDDLERVVQFRDKAMTGRDIAEVEYRIVWPSGEVRHLRSAKQLICDPQGKPLRSLGTTLDITGYRRLAESLSKEKERLLLATRVGGVGIWELVDGRYLWDDQMYSLYGLKPGAFKGSLEEWLGFLHPDDAPRIIEQWQAALGGCSPFADTFRIIQPSGEWRHIRARAQITIGPDGTSIGALGTNWDVSEQIRLNEALFVEKERLSLATKAAGVGIWEYDFDRDQCLWDARTHEIFGHGPGHFRSDTKPGAYGGALEESLKILHPDDAIRIRAQYKKAAEFCDPGVMEMEFRAAGENGTWRHIRTLARVISDSRGVAKRLVGMNWDITAEQEAEDALRMAKESAEAAEKSKSEFLAIMSHELRTPMNGVLGFAELLSRTELQPKQENFVEAITSSGDALLRIIDDILDFSRIEAGQMPIENAPFSLVAVIHEVCELLSARNKRQNVELKSEISPRTPARVIGDAWRLRQVLINLAGNALKFTSEGEVWIRVDSEGKNGPTEGMDIQFSVTDTGQGMSSDALERIFKPFTQADASIARRYGGSGLGLAISEKLVNLMGGTLRGTSRLGEGSEFAFTLSLQPVLSEFEDEPIPRKVFSRDFAVEHPLSILIADDDPLNRKLAQLFLQDLGYQPATATNGLEAIELFLLQKPDVVLIDEQMPGLSGLEVAARIREIEASNSMPNHSRCYISAVTASALASTQEQCFAVGMDDYMTKPLATETLAGVLTKASDRRKSAGTV